MGVFKIFLAGSMSWIFFLVPDAYSMSKESAKWLDHARGEAAAELHTLSGDYLSELRERLKHEQFYSDESQPDEVAKAREDDEMSFGRWAAPSLNQ